MLGATMVGVAFFEVVADEYDAARRSYPDAVFDELCPLEGLKVLDEGAGTGIATRALIARRADVVRVDPGREVLRRAAARTPGLAAVAADGAALPLVRVGVDLEPSVLTATMVRGRADRTLVNARAES